MSTQKMAVCYDTQSCIKCFACVVNCAVENRTRLERDYNYGIEKSAVEAKPYLNYLTVEYKETGTYPDVKQVAAFKHCMHCETPKCADVCPTKAIVKHDSTDAVTINHDKCVGCQACTDACPYNIPVFSKETGKTHKCIMCHDRLEAGLKTACSEACPSVAMFSSTADEVLAEAKSRAENYEKTFNKKFIVYGADKVSDKTGSLSFITIAPADNMDDYLIPANPSHGISTARNVTKTLGTIAVAGAAAGVAVHRVYSTITLPKSELCNHDDNKGGSHE